MATTVFRRDHLLRVLVAPTSASLDSLGRATTSTADHLGRSLVSKVFANTTAYTAGEYVQLAAGTPVFLVTVAGTSAGSAPTAPGPGATVVSGTATLQQVHP